MVWGMGFNDGFEYSYGFKMLNGNPRKIEYEDTTPELYTCGGHFEPGRLRLGRRLKMDHVPTKLIWTGPIGKAPDVLNAGSLFYVSAKFKNICEAIEPNTHQFEPVTVKYQNNQETHNQYLFNICSRLDTVCPINSTAIKKDDRYWDHETGSIVFSLEKIGDHHIWVDRHRYRGIYTSDKFKTCMTDAGVTGLVFGERPSI